jgi:cytochrome b involved in lipid metabolism
VTAPAASVAVSAPAASTPGVPTRTISRATVARHASARSCWTVVNGTVYDLTGWVSRHPGGRGAVLSMCGRDGSAAFNAQHGSAGAASSSLRTYAIGRAVR